MSVTHPRANESENLHALGVDRGVVVSVDIRSIDRSDDVGRRTDDVPDQGKDEFLEPLPPSRSSRSSDRIPLLP